MTVSKDTLLRALPPYQDDWVMVKKKQEVRDIIAELEDAYPEFAEFYDKIGAFFEGSSIEQTCDNLYEFCKRNIQYREEPEEVQTSALPTGILTRGYGDCKAYASFIGGCLGAIGRETGNPIDWEYCFASYNILQKTPYHVFVVVHTDNGDIWVDPTPGAAGVQPVWQVLRRVDTVPKIAGVGAGGDLLFEQGKIGAAGNGLSVPPTAIPLPNGYPTGLPSPYVTDGKIQFAPVPPNFDPTPEQVAWMMWALQVWVIQYGTQKYNVFQWRYHTDGTGASIASFVAQFCRQYNPKTLELLKKQQLTLLFDRYASFDQRQDVNSRIFVLQNIMDFDFGNPPPPFTPSAVDKIMDTIAVTVLKFASNLLPVIGPAYASFWLKEFTSTEGAVFTGEVAQDAGGIASQAQAAADEAARKKRIMTYAVIGAAVLALWWYYSDDD
jgi:hypothetical protein